MAESNETPCPHERVHIWHDLDDLIQKVHRGLIDARQGRFRYMTFSQLPPDEFHHIWSALYHEFRQPVFRLFLYVDPGRLVIAYLQKLIDNPGVRLSKQVTYSLASMGCNLKLLGWEEPSLVPSHAPVQVLDWPPMVIESGYVENLRYLRIKMYRLFHVSQGAIKVVVLVYHDAPPDQDRRLVIEKWHVGVPKDGVWGAQREQAFWVTLCRPCRLDAEGVPVLEDFLVQRRNANIPLYFAFESLMRRPTREYWEGDVYISDNNLRDVAREPWRVLARGR